jgi:putative FmdB family regulatory protein
LPVYEYSCSKGHEYERTEGFSAPTSHRCECGATARRKISRPAVIFKGSGFYSTDNRKSGGRSGSSDISEPSTNGSSASETKTDSKVEASVD